MRSFNRAPQQLLFSSFAMVHFCLFHGKCKEKILLFSRFLVFFLPHSISNVLTILVTFLSYIGLSYFKKRGRLAANTHLHSKYPFQLITEVV